MVFSKLNFFLPWWLLCTPYWTKKWATCIYMYMYIYVSGILLLWTSLLKSVQQISHDVSHHSVLCWYPNYNAYRKPMTNSTLIPWSRESFWGKYTSTSCALVAYDFSVTLQWVWLQLSEQTERIFHSYRKSQSMVSTLPLQQTSTWAAFHDYFMIIRGLEFDHSLATANSWILLYKSLFSMDFIWRYGSSGIKLVKYKYLLTSNGHWLTINPWCENCYDCQSAKIMYLRKFGAIIAPNYMVTIKNTAEDWSGHVLLPVCVHCSIVYTYYMYQEYNYKEEREYNYKAEREY